jgi:hypothetical protein
MPSFVVCDSCVMAAAIDDLPRFRRKRRSTERLLNEFATPDSIPWRTQRQTCTVS